MIKFLYIEEIDMSVFTQNAMVFIIGKLCSAKSFGDLYLDRVKFHCWMDTLLKKRQ